MFTVIVGADVSLCDTIGHSLSSLFIAAARPTTGCLQSLLQHGAGVSMCNRDGGSPLFIAVSQGKTECLMLLLRHSADVSLCDKDVSPLFIDASQGKTECLQLLLQIWIRLNVYSYCYNMVLTCHCVIQ